MRTSLRLALADLRDSWPAWLSVSLTFVVTNTALAICALGFNSTLVDSRGTGVLEGDGRSLFLFSSAFNVVITGLVGLAVLGSATRLVVASRRAALARLLLAGAGPGQVVAMIALQLVVVALACSLVGSMLAVALQPPVMSAIAEDRGFPAPEPVLAAGPLLLAGLACAALAVIGGLRQTLRATKISPLAAQREAAEVPTRRSRISSTLRLGFLILVLAGVAGAVVAFRAAASELGSRGGPTLMQIAFYAIPIVGLALAIAAPVLVGAVSRWWTAVVPRSAATWHLGRLIVVARAERLTRSVVPVMFAVGLLTGMMTLTDTMGRTLRANGDVVLDGTSLTSLLSLVGLPLAVAIAGSVGNLVMLAQQRDMELALVEIGGSTQRQRWALPVIEASIVVGTAVLFSLVMAAVPALVLWGGLDLVYDVTAFGFPWLTMVQVMAVCWVVCVAATVLPTLRTLPRSAISVVGRMAAA